MRNMHLIPGDVMEFVHERVRKGHTHYRNFAAAAQFFAALVRMMEDRRLRPVDVKHWEIETFTGLEYPVQLTAKKVLQEADLLIWTRGRKVEDGEHTVYTWYDLTDEAVRWLEEHGYYVPEYVEPTKD